MYRNSKSAYYPLGTNIMLLVSYTLKANKLTMYRKIDQIYGYQIIKLRQ